MRQLAWWWAQKTNDAALMGAVLVFAITPSVPAFYLIGGVAVDRFSRVGLVLASDIARGIVVVLCW